MDSVDPPQPEAPWIHHDDPDPVGPENPDMKDNIQRIKLLISIWSPYARFVSKWYSEDQELQIRLKRFHQVVQKVIQRNEEDMVGSAVSNLNILKSLVDEIFEIDDLRRDSNAITSPSSVYAGEVVSLMDSVLQNLNDAFVLLAADNTRTSTIMLHVKEEQVESLKEKLIVFRNFLCLIPNRMLISDQDCVDLFENAQMIALTIAPFLYVVVCSINGVEEFAWNVGDAFRYLLATFDNVMGELMDGYLESLLVAAAPENDNDDDDDRNPTIDEKALEFVDYLIHKLKLMMLSYNEDDTKDQFNILIDELSFLRYSLMEDLLLLNKNPIIKEMKSLTISARALVFKTGSFFCKSRDFKQEDERMVEYCCLKIPDLLRAVDDIKKKASDLFNHYFFSSRNSRKSSNYPSTANVLECVNFIINKLEQLLRSKANPLNALEPHMENVYEQQSFSVILLNILENRTWNFS
ncbi:hypothetical protein ACH5RR_034492 [Cinchona calisaya]|uniref:Late blight resistance protein R1A-like N-terminal domain-containing protein n=1 Tax=Cinchona calisaya TaxID=153742 RepID=A0ABD2YB32_9GENT